MNRPEWLTPRRSSALQLAALCALLLVLAALRPMAVPDEGRYGEIGRWMLQSGDWLVPRLNGIPFFHKPPLVYWLEASAIAVFGASVWSVRLMPALHAMLMLATLYLAGRAIGGEPLGRRAGLMLGTSLAFLVGGQYVNHDMAVAAWISVAIGCFAFSMNREGAPHAGLARMGFVACAFGVLCKGLIGLALPGLVLLVWLVWAGLWRQILRLPWLSGLALFAVIALPWFVLAQSQYPQMLGYMFGTHQFGRYTGTTFNNARPWWFYLLCLAILMFPWVLFAGYEAVRGWRQRGARQDAEGSARGRWRALAWIWIVAIVGFFSIPNSKLIGYVLPVMPPLALLAAEGYGRLRERRAAWGRVFAALALGAVLIAVVANQVAARRSRADGTAALAQVLACRMAAGDTVYALDDYPYDLPFRLRSRQPMVVVQDWPALRQSAGDNWRRELFEGADFDPAAARVLQTPDVLVEAARRPGQWLVTAARTQVPGFKVVLGGPRWALQLSAGDGGSASERPPAAQQPGLPGCGDQGHEQRQK